MDEDLIYVYFVGFIGLVRLVTVADASGATLIVIGAGAFIRGCRSVTLSIVICEIDIMCNSFFIVFSEAVVCFDVCNFFDNNCISLKPYFFDINRVVCSLSNRGVIKETYLIRILDSIDLS